MAPVWPQNWEELQEILQIRGPQVGLLGGLGRLVMGLGVLRCSGNSLGNSEKSGFAFGNSGLARKLGLGLLGGFGKTGTAKTNIYRCVEWLLTNLQLLLKFIPCGCGRTWTLK